MTDREMLSAILNVLQEQKAILTATQEDVRAIQRTMATQDDIRSLQKEIKHMRRRLDRLTLYVYDTMDRLDELEGHTDM
jgi:predicted nuclease with TOPRIM domain